MLNNVIQMEYVNILITSQYIVVGGYPNCCVLPLWKNCPLFSWCILMWLLRWTLAMCFRSIIDIATVAADFSLKFKQIRCLQFLWGMHSLVYLYLYKQYTISMFIIFICLHKCVPTSQFNQFKAAGRKNRG